MVELLRYAAISDTGLGYVGGYGTTLSTTEHINISVLIRGMHTPAGSLVTGYLNRLLKRKKERTLGKNKNKGERDGKRGNK